MDSQHAPEFGRPDKYSWARLGEALIKRCQERVQEEQKAQQEQRPLAGAPYGDDKKRTLRVGMYRRSTTVATSIRDRTLGLPSDLMYSCLIHLRLQYLEGCSRRSLKCLAYLPVRVLELVQYAESEGGPLLNDKMCWSWSQRAKTEGGFAELQVLRITSKWHQISKTGFLSLRSLLKLMIVDINTPGSSTDHGESNLSGHKLGWRRAPLEVSLFQTHTIPSRCCLTVLDHCNARSNARRIGQQGQNMPWYRATKLHYATIPSVGGMIPKTLRICDM
jgi:hypothetical protein